MTRPIGDRSGSFVKCAVRRADASRPQGEQIIHDWLQIIVVMGQTRDKVLPSLQDDIMALITEKTSQTLHQLFKKELGPWDLVFSGIFRLVQLGKLTSNLKEKPLAWNTLLQPWR